ncbi:MAG: ATP-binding protein [Candidatus Rokubacteria bacterium]|nr:ATP-binding protein [Candidatus Rokubacteria bacterium]
MEGQPLTAIPAVIMTCGLPASGKTSTAMRLHAHLGGVLVRSCDVYQELGIVLSEWVTRTQGFTANVAEYHQLRDEASREMARRVDTSLAAGSPVVIVDAVHGERDKRRKLYEICHARGVAPILVLCVCDDFEEVRRRFRARGGREAEPEHEASDLSVFHDIRRRWESPMTDELPDGTRPTILTYETVPGRLTPPGRASSSGSPTAARTPWRCS